MDFLLESFPPLSRSQKYLLGARLAETRAQCQAANRSFVLTGAEEREALAYFDEVEPHVRQLELEDELRQKIDRRISARGREVRSSVPAAAHLTVATPPPPPAPRPRTSSDVFEEIQRRAEAAPGSSLETFLGTPQGAELHREYLQLRDAEQRGQ